MLAISAYHLHTIPSLQYSQLLAHQPIPPQPQPSLLQGSPSPSLPHDSNSHVVSATWKEKWWRQGCNSNLNPQSLFSLKSQWFYQNVGLIMFILYTVPTVTLHFIQYKNQSSDNGLEGPIRSGTLLLWLYLLPFSLSLTLLQQQCSCYSPNIPDMLLP